MKLGRVLLRPLLAALPLVALPVVASESESLGSIRALEIEPPSCQLQPSFSAVTTFYVVDCPEQVKQVTLNAESVFELFANGAPLKQPRIVQQLGVGTAKVLVLQACVGEATGCRHYTLDLHRAGSSEALLAELLVTSGGTDVALSPPFHPSVKLYRTDVPFASTTTSVMASAAKGGFVSFRSFSSADRHSQSVEVEVPSEGKSLGSEERPSQWKALRTLKVFVVSADWDGKMEYTLQFGRAPNADATLAAIASNVGAPYPVGEDLRRYMLEVPRGTREVALSATAVDKEGAQVTLDGQHGRGYASAVVKLNPSAPYKRLKIRVEAADEVTVLDYVLVVAMTEHSKWAMLEDLVVPGCEGGLLPKFETDVFRYRCLLNNEAQVLKVIPTVMWMPGFDQKLQISIKDKEWKSGNVFQQPLNDEGKAEVDIAVLASDRKHKAMYYVSAQGSPLKERGRLFTTLEPPPRSPPTPLPQYRFRSTTPQPQLVPQPPAPPTPQPRSTTERASISTLRPSVAPAVPMSLPLPRWPDGLPLSGIHLPIPELQLSGLLPASAADSAGVAGVLAAGGSVAALLASHELTSFMLLLKELQFLAISHQVAGDSYYALLTEPFRVFLLEIDWPGLEVCVIERWEREERGDAGDAGEGDCKTLPNEKAAEATMVWLAALPLAFLLLALGCVEATWEEQLLRKSQLRGLGLRGLRIKALPLALILLDVGLLGLTNSSKVFLPNMAVKVSIFGPGRLWISGVLSTLTLRWLCWGVALGFCGFGSAQLLRLQLSGLLCWSPKLAKFADSSTLAVTLRDSAYPRPAATAWAAMAEACDGFTELRAAVPICGPERQVLCLTDDRFSWQHKSSKRQSRKGAYEGCLFAVLPPEEALLARESIFTGSSTSRSARDLREIAKASCQEQEAGGDPHRRKLLAEGSGAAAWQLQREHLGLLIWLERRCDAYDALKVQISEATGHGVITDAEGWPIYDCQGQPLRDLYQYCIYQFPWRPWLRTLAGRNPGCSLTGAREPYRKGTGVLAPWVPSVAGVQELERQQINDWLSEWLVESEAASAAREELRQLRWCAQELQHAVLMEMALAVLERRSFRAPSGTPREAARASQRLDKLVTTPQPWQQQVDGLGSHEILAFLHEELLDSDDMPFYDEELVPDFLDASFGVLRFHVRGCGENPNPGAPPELPRRPPIRVSESLSPRRPPAARVQHAVRRLQVRENMVTVKLPLKHLEIMVRWLPSFGFAVPSKNVALPLSERWRPLFVSFGSCPKCRDCPAAAGAGTGSDNLRISSPFLALQVDSLDRLFSLLCVFLLDGEGYKGLLGLLLWPLLSALLRLRCRGSGSLGISASYAQEVTLGRRDPHWNPHSGFPAFPNMPWLPWLQLLLGLSLFLRKVTGLSKAMDVLTSLLLLYQSFLRCLLPAARLFLWKILKRRPILRGWRLHLAEEWNKQAALIVLGISSNDHPYPDYGIVQAVDKGFAGEAPNLLFVVRMLGLQLWGMQTSEVGGAPGQEAPSTNQRRLQGLRKLFILFEPCPPGLTDARPRPAPASGQGEVLDSVRQSLRFKEEIRDPIPVATTREQVVGVEELPQVVATIQVVNHLGRHWASSNRHDSFFSLFLPWGLDSRRPTATSQPRGSHDGRGQWKHWRNETFESTKLVATWQSQVLQFLDEELAAGSLVAHGILDLLFFAGNPGRGAFEEEVDKLLVPGIFTDDCLGTKRFCDSRCFREGRILHYVIASKDLKPGRRAWRPDPLAAHAASLFLSSNSSSASLPSASESDPGSLEGLNFWRPCLLRLNSRQVSYVLQKGEEEAEEAAAAAMAAGAIDHGDALEYRIPFVFLDRIEVSRGLRGHEDDECLLTFHGVASTPSSSSIATEPEAVAAGEPEECGNPLQLTPGPLRAERASPRGSPRVSPRASLPATAPSLPLVFRVGKEDGEVWAKVIEEYGMFTPPLHIFHYIGDVRDHPRLPGVVYRHGEGDQLWPDGTRYFGQWEEHVYHGTGQLQDPEGQVIYKGQWAHGMKHGEGFYRFFQEPSGSRAYSGHFQREEFSGRGILWVVEEDGSLEWVQKHRPWAITRYEGKFSGGSEVREPRSLILVDERDGVALHEYFPVLQNEAGVGPHQGPGKAPKDLAAETYGLDAADLQHCGPDADAEIWYADGTRYHGPCLPGAVPHGEGGTLWEEAGLCFEGTFDRGLRAPKGRASLPNGVIYEGDFSQPGGRRHGSGTTSIPEALQRRLGFRSYVGHYLHGLRHGQGEMIFTDGTVYRGKFEKNRRHGHGHYRTQDGTPIYTGPWKNDEPGTGYADILYPSGHRYKGKVCDGCRDGKGSLWHQDSDGDSTFLYCGHWEADEMHGEGELHCSDGVYRGQFVNGLREGKGRFEYARSKDTLSYYEGEWEEDQPQGIGTFVDEHGQEFCDREFEQGDLVGNRLTGRSKRIFSVKTISSVSLSLSKQKPSSSKVLPGPKKEIPHAGTVCQNAGLLPEEEPAQTRVIDVGSGVSNARSRPAHCGPEDSMGLRWA